MLISNSRNIPLPTLFVGMNLRAEQQGVSNAARHVKPEHKQVAGRENAEANLTSCAD